MVRCFTTLLHASICLQTDSAQWSNVLLANGTADPAWSPGSVVALIQWVPKLTRTTMPRVLRQAILAGTQISLEEIVDMEKEEIGELVQWTDLAIFDYLTGNYDRVASMLVSTFCSSCITPTTICRQLLY